MEELWFDNVTQSYFKSGDRVLWLNAEEKSEGTLEWISKGFFCVKWEDGESIEYGTESLKEIKKL